MQIIVLGMHRSGTSIASRLLNMMGAYFAPEGESTGANKENPKGFWERRDVRQLNDFVLHSCGSDWNKVSDFSLDRVSAPVLKTFEREASDILLDLDGYRPWFIKEPRLCILLPLWLRHMEIPVVLFVSRDPLEVAQSLNTRNSMSLSHGIALWEYYTISALRYSANLKKVFLRHSTLLESPVDEVARLQEELLQCDVLGLRIPRSREIISFIDPTLYRAKVNRAGPSDLLNGSQIELAMALADGSISTWKDFPEVSNECRLQLAREEARMPASTKKTATPNFENFRRNRIKMIPELQNKVLQQDQILRDEIRALQGDVKQIESRIRDDQVLRKENQVLRKENQELRKINKGLASASSDLRKGLKRITSEMADLHPRLEKSLSWPRILRVLIWGPRRSISKIPTNRLRTIDAELREIQEEFRARTEVLKQASRSKQMSTRNLSSKDSVSPRIYSQGALIGSGSLSLQDCRHLGIDIVVCVHNAPQDTAKCVESIYRNTFVDFSLFIVDDGSEPETSSLLKSAAQKYRNIILIRNESPKGYSVAANQGLAETNREFVLMLNSDTILPPGWAERLIAPAYKLSEIGIVGPVSNAATFQSIPEVVSADGKWMVNELPPGWTIDGIDRLVRRSSDDTLIDTSLVNGFCFLIKRAVLEKVGLFDEATFPRGYGEETDFCLKTVAAGFRCAITPLLYVYHAKSKSFGSETRAEICKKSNEILWDRYGKEDINKRTNQLKNSPELAGLRDSVKRALERQEVTEMFNQKPRIGFLLPCEPGGGGVHSVVQESTGLLRLGHDVTIFVREKNKERYFTLYNDIIREHPRLFQSYDSPNSLIHATARYDVITATIFTSVKLLNRILDAHPHILGAYYIQDYEPLFFDKDSDSALHAEAMGSYTMIEGCVMFAKTYWLIDLLKKEHGVHAHKVVPSIDHSVYYPPANEEKLDTRPIVLSAMVRVSSARRAPENTMHVLSELKQSFKDSIDVKIFGTPDSDLRPRPLESSFKFTNLGYLTRSEVADLLRESDVFLDLSTYQAFGRTALEAMACGTAVVVPQDGGCVEYAINDQNCLVLDTGNLPLVIEKVSSLLKRRDRIDRFRREGIKTASRFRIESASSSIGDLFSYYLNYC